MATDTTSAVADLCRAAKAAAAPLAALDTRVKDAALHAIADALVARAPEILEANQRDLEAGRANEIGPALLDRLALDRSRIAAIADGARAIAALPDPVGETIDGHLLPNGIDVRRVRVPFGVVAVIYEARPNVTIDAAALCLKSGNAIVPARILHRHALERGPCDHRLRGGDPGGRPGRRDPAARPAAAARSWPSWRRRTASST